MFRRNVCRGHFQNVCWKRSQHTSSNLVLGFRPCCCTYIILVIIPSSNNGKYVFIASHDGKSFIFIWCWVPSLRGLCSFSTRVLKTVTTHVIELGAGVPTIKVLLNILPLNDRRTNELFNGKLIVPDLKDIMKYLII